MSCNVHNGLDINICFEQVRNENASDVIRTYNLHELLAGRDEIIANIRLIKKTLCKTANLEKEKDALEQELTVVVDMMQNLVSENARVAQDQGDYQKRYDALMERYDSVQASIDEVTGQIANREAKAIRLTEFAKELKNRDGLIEEFDSRLWGSLVEYVTIGKDKDMTFRFRDGTKRIILQEKSNGALWQNAAGRFAFMFTSMLLF